VRANHHFPTAAALAAVLAGAAMAACNPSTDKTSAATRTEGNATTLADKAANTASDAAITVAVNSALMKDDKLSALHIDVKSVDGHVVLDGSAPDADARQRASKLARAVDGVKSVDNRLALPPTS
jgi:hyperosmotically inducible periplasmic protein